MIQREIEVFDKKTENLVSIINITIPDEDLFCYFSEYVKKDPFLYYSYDLSIQDIIFFKKYISLDFKIDIYDYVLSCSEI